MAPRKTAVKASPVAKTVEKPTAVSKTVTVPVWNKVQTAEGWKRAQGKKTVKK